MARLANLAPSLANRHESCEPTWSWYSDMASTTAIPLSSLMVRFKTLIVANAPIPITTIWLTRLSCPRSSKIFLNQHNLAQQFLRYWGHVVSWSNSDAQKVQLILGILPAWLHRLIKTVVLTHQHRLNQFHLVIKEVLHCSIGEGRTKNETKTRSPCSSR